MMDKVSNDKINQIKSVIDWGDKTKNKKENWNNDLCIMNVS